MPQSTSVVRLLPYSNLPRYSLTASLRPATGLVILLYDHLLLFGEEVCLERFCLWFKLKILSETTHLDREIQLVKDFVPGEPLSCTCMPHCDRTLFVFAVFNVKVCHLTPYSVQRIVCIWHFHCCGYIVFPSYFHPLTLTFFLTVVSLVIVAAKEF